VVLRYDDVVVEVFTLSQPHSAPQYAFAFYALLKAAG